MRKIRPYLLAFILGVIVFAPIIHYASRQRSDYTSHITHAAQMQRGEQTHISHPLFHAQVILYGALLPAVAPIDIGFLAGLTAIALLLPLLLHALRNSADGRIPDAALIFLALCLAVIAPLTIWADSKLLIGYINPTVYHNPPQNLLRLFVIPVSLLALRIFHGRARPSVNQRLYILLLCGALLMLSTLAKPAYTIALLPGCCLFALWRAMRGISVDWALLIFGVCLPGTLILGLQFLNSYINSAADSSIAFGFLTYMKLWLPAWRIPAQLLLSIAFPLAVYALYWADARRDTYLNLSWVVFITAALWTYSFYEEGRRLWHGNFLWTGYIALFVLMFASLRFLLGRYLDALRATEEDAAPPLKRLPPRFMSPPRFSACMCSRASPITCAFSASRLLERDWDQLPSSWQAPENGISTA